MGSGRISAAHGEGRPQRDCRRDWVRAPRDPSSICPPPLLFTLFPVGHLLSQRISMPDSKRFLPFSD